MRRNTLKKKLDPKLTEKISSTMIDLGADLVGIAPVDRFKNAPKGHGPLDYMPEAKNVISICIHVADGVCDAWGECTQPGKTIGPYLFYGYGLVNLEMSRIANRIAKQLESLGYKCLLFPPTWTISNYRSLGLGKGRRNADFSHRHAAVAAGIGEFGWNGLVMTPIYGSRVRLNSIITSAPLVPSPMYDGPKLCQPERCKYLCASGCPAQAISKDKKKEVEIGGKVFYYNDLEFLRCFYGVAGLVKGSGCYNGFEIPPGPQNEEQLFAEAFKLKEARDERDKFISETCPGIVCGDFCGRCFHQCPAHIYSRTGVKSKQKEARSG